MSQYLNPSPDVQPRRYGEPLDDKGRHWPTLNQREIDAMNEAIESGACDGMSDEQWDRWLRREAKRRAKR